MTLVELKRALTRSGFEIYRTFGDSVALVERVRENLILDSGIRVSSTTNGYKVRVVFRAEGRGFPGENEEQMKKRAETLTHQATQEGFWAVGEEIVPQMDPSNPGVELDRFYEVTCERDVTDFEATTAAVRRAFAWMRSVPVA